jgi:ribosomal protein S18 acetylase RimI-like enzyme
MFSMTSANGGSDDSLVLRQAVPEDRDFLWDLYQATMMGYVRAALGLDSAGQRANFDRRMDLAQSRIVVREGRDIGVLTVIEAPWGTLVQQLAILPQFQGQGIGTSLLRTVVEESARRGRSVGLTVLRCNPAWKLYLRLGFRIVGTSDTHYRMVRPVPRAGRGR